MKSRSQPLDIHGEWKLWHKTLDIDDQAASIDDMIRAGEVRLPQAGKIPCVGISELMTNLLRRCVEFGASVGEPLIPADRELGKNRKDENASA